jgi:hypothetical protein
VKTWKTLSRRVVLDYSEFLAVEEHTVELPDGQVIADWPWVITPDYVNIWRFATWRTEPCRT